MTNANPFEVLSLDPSASEEQVVQQAGRLRLRSPDDSALAAIRQAVRALTGRVEDRELHALLAHPQPVYAWPALEKLVYAYRRAPTPTAAPSPCPPLDLAEFAALVRAHFVEELELGTLPFEPLTGPDDASEIQRQAAEALWQSLICDPRA
jgi:hypothetical protein